MLYIELKITFDTQKTLASHSNKLYMTLTVHRCGAFHKQKNAGLSVYEPFD